MQLYVMFGLPGSGKTTWATNHARTNHAMLASTDATRTHKVNTVNHLNRLALDLEQALTDGHDVVLDACNIQTALRRRWLRIGLEHHAECTLVVMGTDHATSIGRNLARPADQRVPSARMVGYVRDWKRSLAVARTERWHHIIHTDPTPGRNW